MNWLDLSISLLLLIAFFNGYRKGLIMQIIGLATIVLAAIFGGKLAQRILPEISRLIDLSPEVAKVISFVLAFVAIAVALSLIGRVVQRFVDVVLLGLLNRLLGAVIAAGTMALFLSIILNLVTMLDTNEQVINRKTKEKSFFYPRVEAVVPAIVPYLKPQLWDEYIPGPFREKMKKNNESIDSTYQHRYFKTNLSK